VYNLYHLSFFRFKQFKYQKFFFSLVLVDEKAWERVISLNVKGVFHLTKALTPLLEQGAKVSQQNARVINIGSVDGMRPPAMDTWAYSTSKAAVHMVFGEKKKFAVYLLFILFIKFIF